MSSIYRADAGTDPDGRAAGAVHRARRRLQPGADVARERGPQRRDDGPRTRARRARRLDAVLDFAELREFVDLKLKNYSSGMMVRLAFAVMVEADADIMLVDEVLAVGDAAFAPEVHGRLPREARAPGRTIVLVTHDMATVAELLRPRDAASTTASCATSATPRRRRCATTALNFGGDRGARAATRGRRAGRQRARRSTPGSRTPAGERVENVEQGEPIGLGRRASRRARDLEAPVFGFHFLNADGADGVRLQPHADAADGETDVVAAGSACGIAGEIENPLAARALLRQLLDLAQPRRRATSRCTCCGCSTSSSTARSAGPGSVSRRAPTSRPPARSHERRALELRDVRGPSALGGGWRRVARAALPDRGHRVQAHLLRHRARLPVVARAAADAVRRPAGRLHAGVRPRRSRCRTIRCCCCSTSCCSASSRRRRRRRSTSIVGQESVVRKTQFPRLVIPLAVVLTSLFNLGAEPRRRVRLPARRRASTPMWTWLLFPLVLALLIVLTDGGVDDRRRRCTRASATSAIIWTRRRRPRCSTRRRCSTRSRSCPARCATCSRSTRSRRSSSWRASG